MEENAGLERPPQVTRAVYLLYLDLGIGAARGVLECTVPGGNSSEGLGMLGLLPIPAIIYYMIGKGKNWARITFLTLSVLGIILFVTQPHDDPLVSGWLKTSRVSLEMTGIVIELVALALLFERVSSGWFRAVSGPVTVSLWNMVLSLRNTDQPVVNYVWRAWLIVLIPTVLIGIAASVVGEPGSRLPDRSVASWIIGALVVAPWLETLLMWPILAILKRFIGKTVWVALVSGVIFGLLHLPYAPGWGTPQMWGFFVLSVCFLEWKKKSTGRAITVTALVHTGQNLVPIFVMVLFALFGT